MLFTIQSAGAKKEEKKKNKKAQPQSRPDSGRPQSAKQQLQQAKAKGRPQGVEVILQPTAEIVIEGWLARLKIRKSHSNWVKNWY